MVSEEDTICPICNSELIFFDRAKRIVRTKGRKTYWVRIDRMKCTKCGTTGMSYDTLRVQTSIPCSRDVYYECYRKFFWLLDKARA